MPESCSTPTPRGTLRALRREALTLRHLSDADTRARLLQHGPAHLVEQALARRAEVLRRGFLDREPDAARFEVLAHAEHNGLGQIVDRERARRAERGAA